MAQEIIIRLRDVSTGKTFTFPANPESISGTLGAKYQSFDIISKGTVKVPKGTDVSEIKWSGEFFGYSKRNESVVNKAYYQLPNACVAQLREWQENGNVKYSISFAQAKDLKIYTTNELKIAAFVKKTAPRNDNSQSSGSSYTIVSGDTLWGIASKKLGSGTKWTKIYERFRPWTLDLSGNDNHDTGGIREGLHDRFIKDFLPSRRY